MATHAHSTPERRPEAATLGAGRRSLFGAVTALAYAPVLGVSAVSAPDAKLIQLTNAFKHEAHHFAAVADGDADPGTPEAVEAERAFAAIDGRMWPLVEAIRTTPVTTLAGLQALAAALVAWDTELLEGGKGYRGDLLLAHLVGGLLALRGAA